MAELTRPDPEQLLRNARKEKKLRGKLKIFFGACAGAGKTYAMLLAAHEKQSEGIDVVCGIIETHGRLETAKLQEGLPILFLKNFEYEGIRIAEFDLDAAIARKPDILLVDELAHTNATASRHPKRWQDVNELLDCGIDVYTTLNVQHLESLNDVVANLTKIRVKETVPDSIFENADEIVLVDIPSEIIIERLNEGKVYLGGFAKQRAAQNFFKMENLIALREIALRRTAEGVDALRDTYKSSYKNQSIADKILVCIAPKTISAKLVRTAKQQAIKLKCSWGALYVENSEYLRLSQEEKNYIEKMFRLTEQLGGKTEIVPKSQTAQAIIDYAHEHSFTKIFVGKSTKPKWKQRLFGTLATELIEKSGNIDVNVINEDSEVKFDHPFSLYMPWRSYLYALFIIASCTLIGLPMRGLLGSENFVMLYLAGIVIISMSSERSIAILSALLSVLCYSLFFTPFYSLTYHIRNIVTLLVLLFTSLLISSQISQLRVQSQLLREHEKRTAALYAFTRKLMVTPGKAKISKVIARYIGENFDCAATVWLPNEAGNLELASHPGIKAELKEASVAQWAYSHQQISGSGTNTMPSAKGYYLPLFKGETIFGVLGVIPKDPHKIFSLEENERLGALALQAAAALERVKIAAQMEKAKHQK